MEQGRVRFWQGFSFALVLILVATVVDSRYSAVAQSEKLRYTEIDVERINIVESDGTVKLVIANRQRAPDQVVDGQSRPRAANNKSPGITFFDDAGDEAGGLKVRGDRRVGPSARRHLVFDQHRGDQVIGLITDESEAGRTAGMTVWDRPETPLLELAQRYEKIISIPPGPERAKLEAAFEGFGATCVFAGKTTSGDGAFKLSDAKGRERLRLIVTPQGDARIEFLDEQGRPTLTLPPTK